MISKFWMCVTILSLLAAHIYVFTLMEEEDVKPMSKDFSSHFAAARSRIADSCLQLKQQIIYTLKVGQNLTKLAGKSIATYRAKRQLVKNKKAQKIC